jgi:hypothetical protein
VYGVVIRASQSKPCHRRVYTYRPTAIEDIKCVQFTDNTTMSVMVRPANKREKIQEIWGYDELLNKFATRKMTGFVRVADLHKEEGNGI